MKLFDKENMDLDIQMNEIIERRKLEKATETIEDDAEFEPDEND